MEFQIILLLGLFIFLLIINSKINEKSKSIEHKLSVLNKKLDELKNNEATIQNTEILRKPIEIVENPIESQTKPIFDTTPKIEKSPIKPSIIESENKVVFSETNTVQPKPAPKPYVPQKSWWETFKEKNPDLEKFIGENLINKIGVLILVLGISYFVKYSIDKGWINEPARVGIGVLSGALVMGVAHKLRAKFAAFSSVFVAGAIAVFYFTIAIAFHSYHLFGQTTAFVIMTIITVFSCLISLSYNRIELAVLSLIGGFAVPFMLDTGSGNYIALFSYITLLNIGVLAIAYFKKWNLLNLLTYVFTVVLFGCWLFNDISSVKPHYFGGFLFAFLFYFIFIVMNIINNIRTKGELSKTQLGILTSNTFLFYAAGMAILSEYHHELKGLFTIILAVLNLVYAWFLYKKFGMDKITIYLLIGLTLTFVTLAIPVQFEGNYITLFWAAEAVLLLWLSQKSGIKSYFFGSIIVTVLAIISLMMDWTVYQNANDLSIVINKICITGIFVVATLIATYFLLKKEKQNTIFQFGISINPEKYSNILIIATLIVGYFVGMLEVVTQSSALVYGQNSCIAVNFLYHLLFSVVLFYFLVKSKNDTNLKLATILGLLNIVLFTFVFSNNVFGEHEDYIRTGNHQRIAFYLHYLALIFVAYFGYTIYKINNEKAVFGFLKSNIMVWITAFVIIYATSTELVLHGLVATNRPITIADINASKLAKTPKDLQYVKQQLTENSFDEIRNIMIRTGFPILWGILAFMFLIIGIKKQNKTLRIVALSLLGLTIAKLFLYDIKNVSETGKIIAFILLGVLILIISFVYQKIKILVIDDAKPKENDKNL